MAISQMRFHKKIIDSALSLYVLYWKEQCELFLVTVVLCLQLNVRLILCVIITRNISMTENNPRREPVSNDQETYSNRIQSNLKISIILKLLFSSDIRFDIEFFDWMWELKRKTLNMQFMQSYMHTSMSMLIS